MQPWLKAVRDDLAARRDGIREGLKAVRVARSREFASVLHSERRLEMIFRGVADSPGPGPVA
jgi:hypothetical protein